jgi:pyoverdine/dityrosine biosynthesis protein Dit1
MGAPTNPVRLSYSDVPTSEDGPDTVQGTSSEESLNSENTSTTTIVSQSSSTEICDPAISEQILEIIFDYALNKFSDTKQRLEAGRPVFLSVINRFVAAGRQLEMCLPAFPFKSANKVYKVLGVLPDKAEEIALDRLNAMCIRIGEIYKPGARCTIISDSLVYNGKLD